MNIFFERVTILGVGLIGASFALAMKKRGLCGSIRGYGRKEANLLRAKQLGIIDSFELDPGNASEGSDLVVFSLPVGSFGETAKRIAGALKEGALVTDVGSVKGGLVHKMQEILSPRTPFVGAHPIAGGEKSGIDTADADLFEGQRCVVTPTEKTERTALDALVSLWRSLGSDVVMMSPEEHDRVLGAVSHFPHIAAYEIVNTVGVIDETYLQYCGRGFRDVTRIALSSPELWRDICMNNRGNLAHFLDVFIGRLERVRGYIAAGDAEALEREFGRAASLREGLGQD
jgi:prephenate dehydrogenase